MGAGKIAAKFSAAVALTDGCEIVAVASKSMERAGTVAREQNIPAAYDDYARMLDVEKPDCVYIATTPNSHHALTMLCLSRGVPVLCEKAMLLSGAEAAEVFALSKRTGVFVMEAMWSRFMPANRRALQWLKEGRIGRVRLYETGIGFLAPADPGSRYLSAALGGGTTFDVTVYAYELADFFLGEELGEPQVSVVWGGTGVSLTDHVVLRYDGALASLTTTFAGRMEEKTVITGEAGRIVLPRPHFSPEAILLDAKGEVVEHYRDEETKNGFIYEIEETIACVRAGMTESAVVPHSLTTRCAGLFDRIMGTRIK
jgi:predicted dehydrogenase